MVESRDIAALCERHPNDDRRIPSTILLGDSRAKVDQSQTDLLAAMARAAIG